MSKNIAEMFGRKTRKEQLYDSVKWVLNDQLIGIEVEVERTNNFREPLLTSGYWTAKGDGSLQNGREYVLVTPLKGNGLSQAIGELFHEATFERKTTGSTHIHVDMLEEHVTDNVVRRMVLLIFILESALFALGDPSREWCGYTNKLCTAPDKLLGAAFCDTADAEAEFTNLCADAAVIGRYYGLNLQALSKFGSLEFRYFPTATSAAELTDWIQLVQSFKKAAMELTSTEELEAIVSDDVRYAAFLQKYFGPWYEVFADTVPQYTARAYFDKAIAVAKAYRHRYSPNYSYEFNGSAVLESKALKKFVKKPLKTNKTMPFVLVDRNDAIPKPTKYLPGTIMLCASGFHVKTMDRWYPMSRGNVDELEKQELELFKKQCEDILGGDLAHLFEVAGAPNLGAWEPALRNIYTRVTTRLQDMVQDQQRQHEEETPTTATRHRYGDTITVTGDIPQEIPAWYATPRVVERAAAQQALNEALNITGAGMRAVGQRGIAGIGETGAPAAPPRPRGAIPRNGHGNIEAFWLEEQERLRQQMRRIEEQNRAMQEGQEDINL